MTFPVVATTATSTETVDTTTHDVTMPASIASGDLLVLFLGFDGGRTTIESGLPAGYTKLTTSQPAIGTLTGVAGVVYYKVATGSETSFTYTTNNAERSANLAWRVTGVGNSPPEITQSNPNGFSATPAATDPLTPSWGSADTLWVAVLFCDDTATISAYPSNYASNQTSLRSTGSNFGAHTAVASRNLTAATEGPGGWTLSTAVDYGAAAVAISPATAGSTVTDPFGMAGFFGG